MYSHIQLQFLLACFLCATCHLDMSKCSAVQVDSCDEPRVLLLEGSPEQKRPKQPTHLTREWSMSNMFRCVIEEKMARGKATTLYTFYASEIFSKIDSK